MDTLRETQNMNFIYESIYILKMSRELQYILTFMVQYLFSLNKILGSNVVNKKISIIEIILHLYCLTS